MEHSNAEPPRYESDPIDETPLILAPSYQVSSRLAAFVRALDAEFELVRPRPQS